MVDREIKFRAWDGKQMRFNAIAGNGQVLFIPNATGEYKWFNLADVMIMQFTGLKDKNGVDIYEGDVIEIEDIRGNVYWDNGSFHIYLDKSQGSNVLNQERANRFSIIGNIHQNPEML